VPSRVLTVARRSPYLQALVVTSIVAVFGGLFVGSYGLALGRPKPHHIPADVVGDRFAHRAFLQDLQRAAGTSLALEPVADEAQARRDIDEQRVYTAVVLQRHPRLLVASASGSTVARVLEQAAQAISADRPDRVQVVDVRPLPASDPNGLVVFYATLAATIMGFVAMFQLRAHASDLRLGEWLGFVALIAVLNGLVIATVSGPLIGGLGGSLPEKWAIIGAESAVAGLVCSTLLVLVGRWAIAVNWLLFVVLGNTSSGGAVAPPLLPPFYEALGRWLPPGATVEALRTAVYFPDAQHAEPVIVLLVWLLGGLAALVVASRRLGRLPTGKEPEAA
jgi:hypothetical protein